MNVTRLYARTGAAVQRLPTQTSCSLLSKRPNLRSYATSAPPAQGHHPHNNRLYLIMLAVGVPVAFWMSARRPNPRPIGTFEERHGLNPEYKQAKEANKSQGRDPDYCEVRS
ncbi:hypothetical protein N7451_010786 [Penicillium sp. IBT 35674x]|nr:hypothetical protein N7451_010786 [Penicillium sp. IBT 35674x]